MRWLRNLHHRIEYGLLRLVVLALRMLPLDRAVAVAGSLCALIAPRTRLHRRAADNLRDAFPDLRDDDHRRLLGRMWGNVGKVIAETLMLDRILDDPGRIEIAERQSLEQILRPKQAVIVLTMHHGNWELVAGAFAASGGRPAAVYRPFRNPYIDRFVRDNRERLYPGGLLARKRIRNEQAVERSSTFAMQHLRRQGLLGMVVDQVDDGARFTVPFFDWEATFTPAPAILARRHNARILICRCVRVASGARFRFDFQELPFERTDHADADSKQITAAVAAQFEAWIREAPEQWMWWQRRAIGVRRLHQDVLPMLPCTAAIDLTRV